MEASDVSYALCDFGQVAGLGKDPRSPVFQFQVLANYIAIASPHRHLVPLYSGFCFT